MSKNSKITLDEVVLSCRLRSPSLLKELPPIIKQLKELPTQLEGNSVKRKVAIVDIVDGSTDEAKRFYVVRDSSKTTSSETTACSRIYQCHGDKFYEYNPPKWENVQLLKELGSLGKGVLAHNWDG